MGFNSSLCCFWCHSQENLFVNKTTGTIHCIGCKGFMSKILNRWNQPCKRVHRVKQSLENAGLIFSPKAAEEGEG